MPKRHRSRPAATLNTAYRKAVIDWPFCINEIFSKAKLEKVVNPPQNPDASNSHSVPPCNNWYLPASPKRIPISKDPEILIANVATGKGFATYLPTI
jgi:hypothetical protein